jgi:hypothetical protein
LRVATFYDLPGIPALTALGELQAAQNNPTEYPPGPLIEDCVTTLNYFRSNDD